MKHPAPSSEPLPNPRHEAFAREIASGRSATQAYANVYGKNRQSGPSARAARTRRAACTGGSRLLRRKCVAARIKAFQQAGAADVALDLQEIHHFLTRVVRTPAGDIVPTSDLCTRVKHLRDGATDVWMPNKLACLRLSAKLQGFLDTARLAQIESAPFDPPPILTEELREIAMAHRSAALQKLADEDRRAQQEPPLGEEPVSAASKNLAQPEAHAPKGGADLPTRDGPSGPRNDTKPAFSGDRSSKPEPTLCQTPGAQRGQTSRETGQPKPGLCAATTGPWIPHWRQDRQSGPDQNQAGPSPVGSRAAALNSQPSTLNRPPASRVTPDSSTGIVII